MRVLIVSEFVPPVRGGLESHVRALTSALADRGHKVAIATLTDNPQPLGERVYSIGGLAHRLPHGDASRPFHPPLPDPVARRALIASIDDFTPDVIHSHNWLAASLPRRLVDPPLVVTLHDYSLVCQLRTLYDSDGRICSGPAPAKCLACGSKQMGGARARLLGPATAYGRRRLNPSAVIAVSHAVADAASPHLVSPVDVIPNFLGAAPEAEQLPADFPAGPFALYAGDLGSHKGVQDLLQAWESGRPAGATLVLAGTRPGRLALPSGVYPTSLTPGQMVSAWKRARLGVVPSRWADPCPTVALEALRAGVPVIATNVGGLPDIVTDEVGRLVPPGDHVRLGAAIRLLWEDEATRRRMSGEGVQASRHFAEDAVVPRIVDVYQAVVAQRLDRSV